MSYQYCQHIMHAILLSNFYCDRTLLKLKKYRYVAKKKLEILYKKFRAAVFIKWGPESDNTVSASLKSGWPARSRLKNLWEQIRWILPRDKSMWFPLLDFHAWYQCNICEIFTWYSCDINAIFVWYLMRYIHVGWNVVTSMLSEGVS